MLLYREMSEPSKRVCQGSPSSHCLAFPNGSRKNPHGSRSRDWELAWALRILIGPWRTICLVKDPDNRSVRRPQEKASAGLSVPWNSVGPGGLSRELTNVPMRVSQYLNDFHNEAVTSYQRNDCGAECETRHRRKMNCSMFKILNVTKLENKSLFTFSCILWIKLALCGHQQSKNLWKILWKLLSTG